MTDHPLVELVVQENSLQEAANYFMVMLNKDMGKFLGGNTPFQITFDIKMAVPPEQLSKLKEYQKIIENVLANIPKNYDKDGVKE